MEICRILAHAESGSGLRSAEAGGSMAKPDTHRFVVTARARAIDGAKVIRGICHYSAENGNGVKLLEEGRNPLE